MSKVTVLDLDIWEGGDWNSSSGNVSGASKVVDGGYLLPLVIMSDEEINSVISQYGSNVYQKTVNFSELNQSIIDDLNTILGATSWDILGKRDYKWQFGNDYGNGINETLISVGGWPQDIFPIFTNNIIINTPPADTYIHLVLHGVEPSNGVINGGAVTTNTRRLDRGLIYCGINPSLSSSLIIDKSRVSKYRFPIMGAIFDCTLNAGATNDPFTFAFAINILPSKFILENKFSFGGGGYGYVFGVCIRADDVSAVSIPQKTYTVSYYVQQIPLLPYTRDVLEGKIIPITPDNPYGGGGTSGSGGGGGNFDDSSDPVDFSPLPTLSAAQAGLISLFNPSLSELRALSSRLWSSDFLDAIVNFFSDPSDIIISLGIVPVAPPLSGRAELQAGLISTGVEMNVIGSQFMAYDCGSVTIEPYYGAALDYAPYTKVSVFLPYIGVRQLNTDEVMGSSVAIRYNIDLFSGACTAQVKVGESVLYTYNGNVVSQIPVSARSYDSLISAVINGATAISGAIATGGATANTAISATVNAVQAAKPEVLRSGNASANIGLLAAQTPYLIFEIPRQSMPKDNQTYVGYPSNITATLGDLTGYTQVETIHLENIPATNGELNEIENLLREGVIL